MDEVIEKHLVEVDGEKDIGVKIFTLSTCMWCKKCKRFLQEKNVKYEYIDMDKIPSEDKYKILDHLRANYQERISYPFLVCDKGYVVGYDPNKYEELMMEGEM